MRGRTKLISIAAILSVMFVTSVIFSSGAVKVSSLSLFSTPVYPDATTNVFVTPSAIVKDYVLDPGYQVGNLLQVHVNITDAVDLFSYQVNVTWSTSMLNFTRIVAYGDFLARTSSPYTTSRIDPTWIASNVTGFASIAETILGDVTGITGSGRLFTIEFLIIGYGSATIGISSAGALPTMLLDSTGATASFTTASCYFRNALRGDATMNRIVDVVDLSRVLYHRTGPPAGPGGYNRDADINDNGIIDVVDMSLVLANRGRTAP